MSATKRKLCISIESENYRLLSWLKRTAKINNSFIIDALLTNYRESITSNMSAYEIEQLRREAAPVDTSPFTQDEIKALSRNALKFLKQKTVV